MTTTNKESFCQTHNVISFSKTIRIPERKHTVCFWTPGNEIRTWDEMAWKFHITIIVTKMYTVISIFPVLLKWAVMFKRYCYTLKSFEHLLYWNPLNNYKWHKVSYVNAFIDIKQIYVPCFACVQETVADFGWWI